MVKNLNIIRILENYVNSENTIKKCNMIAARKHCLYAKNSLLPLVYVFVLNTSLRRFLCYALWVAIRNLIEKSFFETFHQR